LVARRGAPSAAKAGTENRAFYRSGKPLRRPKAKSKAVNRCAAQKQNQDGVLQQTA